MLITEKIEAEINERMNGRFSADNCAKLADLLIIRNHLPEHWQAPAPDTATAAVSDEYDGKSEFMLYASKISSEDALKVADDLMRTLKESHPRLYESVMQKMRQL